MQRSSNIEQFQPQNEPESNPQIVNEILNEMNGNSDKMANPNNGQNAEPQMQDSQQMQEQQMHEQQMHEQQMHEQQMHEQQMQEQQMQEQQMHEQQMQAQQMQEQQMQNESATENNQYPQHPTMEVPKQNINVPPTIKEIRQNYNSIEVLQDPLKVMAIFVLLSLPIWDKLISAQLGKFIQSTNVLSLSIISLKGILAGIIFYIAKRFV